MRHPLYDLLRRLDEGRFFYILERDRRDSITITVSFVGERTEVDVFKDGHMEVSRFLGTEDILGEHDYIYELIDKKIFEDKAWE